MTRCINLDWLECYCLEDYIGYPHDADFFRRQGFHVEQREYGTPVYHEMFVIYGRDDQPLIEVRRNPKSAQGRQLHGVLDANAAHVRLANRTCYFATPAVIMQQFLERYGFHFQRISRVDVCLDFVRFDKGDDPADVMSRYFRHKYTKINQANISAHGVDTWDGRIWNSVSWGNPKSMVGTKFYCKSLELKQRADKPYIRQAWRAAGLVDDDLQLVKYQTDEHGNTVAVPVEVWRVEFSVKSGTRKWFVMEDCSGSKMQRRSVRHTLDMWSTQAKLLTMFASLAQHYFHFKHFKPSTRKDRCADKVLFDFTEQATFYKLQNVATREQPDRAAIRLHAMLLKYQETCVKPELFKASGVLLQALEEQIRRASLVYPWPQSELQLIRELMARRIKCQDKTLQQDIDEIKAEHKVIRQLFAAD